MLQQEYGLSQQRFALVFALGGTALIVGSQTNAALVRKVAPVRLLRAALPVVVVFTAALCWVAVTRTGGLVAFVTLIWFSLAVLGFITSNASALALSRHGERAGTAAATIGFIQSGLAGAVSPLVGVLGGDAVAMTGVMLGAVTAALLVLALATPAYRRGGWLAFSTHDD